jgi:hypothetical protein
MYSTVEPFENEEEVDESVLKATIEIMKRRQAEQQKS